MKKAGEGKRYGKKLFGYLLANCLLFATLPAFAQNEDITISGVVTNTENIPIPFASVAIDVSEVGTITDNQGNFRLTTDKKGSQTILIRSVGYKEKEIQVELAREDIELKIVLTEENLSIGEVTVRGEGKQERIRQTGYAVEVLETQEHKGFASNLDNVIKQSSGINIRETGGLGSGFKLSLNGLSGNQVRFFVDGIPMENAGTALTLNNYPVNLIDQIEVYKGVVPVSLGADALGGAINIVTQNRRKSFLDASYTLGSFNTHKASVNAQTSFENDLFVKFSSFLNHSDNNYRMIDMPVYDNFGNNTGSQNIDRFHNAYTSGMASLEGGILDKKAADEWSVKFTYGQNYKEYQHPDNNILRVFGDFHTQGRSMLLSSVYKKELKKFELRLYMMGGLVEEQVTDTSTFKYNWAGEAFKREPDDPKGEIFERRSLYKMTDKLLRSQLNVAYQVTSASKVNVNFAQNYLTRNGEDEIDELNQSFTAPNHISKFILGVSWDYTSENRRLRSSLFGKQYWYGGTIESFDTEGNKSFSNPGFNKMGLGVVASWQVAETVLLKTSFEKAFRTPESFEILGDGKYVNPNPQLQPESSYNFNVGGRLNYWKNNTNIQSEVNLFNRTSRNFIRFKPLGPFGEYENLTNVLSQGIEGGISVNHNQFAMLDANATFQNLTDQTEFDEGLPNTNYKSRVPNIPYFFGNLRLGISPNKNDSPNVLSLYWNTRYVHEFFLTWEDLGDPDQKYIIPSQLIHDFVADYSLKNGKYSVSVTISNLTDELAYDNFRIQKPGRAFYLKVNWFIQNKSNI